MFLPGEVVADAEVGGFLALVEYELVDFESEDCEAENDARHRERHYFVAPAQQPDGVRVGDQDSASLHQAEHRQHEEGSKQAAVAILTCRIEEGIAEEVAEEEPGGLKAVKSAHRGDHPGLTGVLVAPVKVWLVAYEVVHCEKAERVDEVVSEHGKGEHPRDKGEVHGVCQDELDDVAQLLQSCEAEEQLRDDVLSRELLPILFPNNKDKPADGSVEESERQVEARLRDALSFR